jgi:hypothetical protein
VGRHCSFKNSINRWAAASPYIALADVKPPIATCATDGPETVDFSPAPTAGFALKPGPLASDSAPREIARWVVNALANESNTSCGRVRPR